MLSTNLKAEVIDVDDPDIEITGHIRAVYEIPDEDSGIEIMGHIRAVYEIPDEDSTDIEITGHIPAVYEVPDEDSPALSEERMWSRIERNNSQSQIPRAGGSQ